MALEGIVGNSMAEWMKGTGPESDVVLGSRVRLARNLAGVPFPGVASDEQLAQVAARVREVAWQYHSVGDLEYLAMADLSPLERQLLVERHLISPQHAEHVRHKAVVLRRDEAISVMVNEEDHLRIQSLFSGMQPERAWQLCSQVDDVFESHVEYAFSSKHGYLTACPTNVGTGMRASLMVHLPALVMTDQIQRIIGACSQVGLAVRGLYGEGTEVLGNIFQISNQVTLGHSEEEIIEHLVRVARQILAQERAAREHVLSKDRLRLEDRIFRSYGILANARAVSTQEAMQLLSDVRLGIDLGLLQGLEGRILQELLVLIRPAHLQRTVGRALDAPERDLHRAALIRERIRAGSKHTP